jgi:hypothetical protein
MATDALNALREAVEKFAASAVDSDGEGQIVSQALLIYETVGFDSDGDPYRSIRYSIPTDNFSMSGGLGLIEAARYYIRQAIFSGDGPDGDDD